MKIKDLNAQQLQQTFDKYKRRLLEAKNDQERERCQRALMALTRELKKRYKK
jgi:hypothetical protein